MVYKTQLNRFLWNHSMAEQCIGSKRVGIIERTSSFMGVTASLQGVRDDLLVVWGAADGTLGLVRL